MPSAQTIRTQTKRMLMINSIMSRITSSTGDRDYYLLQSINIDNGEGAERETQRERYRERDTERKRHRERENVSLSS